jgi:septal ring factor EnvC (AmiA/AmiB activator)
MGLRRCICWAWPLLAGMTLCFLPAGASPERAEAQQQSLEKRIDDQQKELERIRNEIEQHRSKSQKLNLEEKDLLKRLSRMDKEIDLSRQFLRKLERQEALFVERIDSLSSRVDVEDSLLARKKAVLGRRLRQMYVRDPDYRWNILLGSRSLEEAFSRYRFGRLAAEQDAALIGEIRSRKRTFEREQAELTESLADIVVVRQEREDEARKLERGKNERQAMLTRIRGAKSEHASAIQELEKAQAEIQSLIGRIEEKRLGDRSPGLPSGGDFARLKGRLMRPVDGKIVRGFGQIKHPKYGTVTFNSGVDIGASGGAPIRAVATGVVEFVDWIDGYGKCIILNHGGGYYTLYAHVSDTFISQGQTVSLNDVIAEVGDTGSLEGYECHFEIRQSKQALNPLEWFSR